MRNQTKSWNTTGAGDVQISNAGKPFHEITNTKDIAEPLSSSNLHLQGACSIGVSAEGKKKKFQPFKELRKIFSKKEKKSANALEDETESHHADEDVDDQVTGSNKTTQEFLSPRMSASQEDIAGTRTRNLSGAFSTSSSSLSGFNQAYSGFAAELATKISQRKYAESNEDLGMSVSPGTSPGVEKSMDSNFKGTHQSGLPSTFSESSLPSMASSENDEDSGFGQTSRHSSKLSLTNDRRSTDSVELLDLDTYQSMPLNHQAARHKLAVRPKKNHGISRHRRLQQLSSPVLPSTPEVCEEGMKKVTSENFGKGQDFTSKSPPKMSSGENSPLSVLTKSFSLRRAQTDHVSPVKSTGGHNTKVARSKSSVDKKVGLEMGRFNRRKHSDGETTGKGRSPSTRDKKLVGAEKSVGEPGHESFFYRLFNGRKSGKRKKQEGLTDSVSKVSGVIAEQSADKDASTNVTPGHVMGSKDILNSLVMVNNSANSVFKKASPKSSRPRRASGTSQALDDSSPANPTQIDAPVLKNEFRKPEVEKDIVTPVNHWKPTKDRAPAPQPPQDRKNFGKKTAPPLPLPHSCDEGVEHSDLVSQTDGNSESNRWSVSYTSQGTGYDLAPQEPDSGPVLSEDGQGQKSGGHRLVPLRKLSPIDSPARKGKILGSDITDNKPFSHVLVNLSFPKTDESSTVDCPVPDEAFSMDVDSLRDSLGPCLDSQAVTQINVRDSHAGVIVVNESGSREAPVRPSSVEIVSPIVQAPEEDSKTAVMEDEKPLDLPTCNVAGRSKVGSILLETPEVDSSPKLNQLSVGRMSPVANKEEESVMVVPNILSRTAGDREDELKSPRHVSEVLDLVKSVSGRADRMPGGRRSLSSLESNLVFDSVFPSTSEVRVVTPSLVNVTSGGVRVVSCPSGESSDPSRLSTIDVNGPQFSCNNVVIRLKSDNPVKCANRHSVPCFSALERFPSAMLCQDKVKSRGNTADVVVNGKTSAVRVAADQAIPEWPLHRQRCSSRMEEVEPMQCKTNSQNHVPLVGRSSDTEKYPSSSGDSDDPDLNYFARREKRAQGSRGRKSLSVNLDEGEPELFKVFAKRSLRRKGDSDGLSSECSSPTRMHEEVQEVEEVECAPEAISDGAIHESVPEPSKRNSFGSTTEVSTSCGTVAAEEMSQIKETDCPSFSSSLGQNEKPDWWKLAQERKERRALREKSTFKSPDEYLIDMARSPINRNSKVLDMVQTFQKLVS